MSLSAGFAENSLGRGGVAGAAEGPDGAAGAGAGPGPAGALGAGAGVATMAGAEGAGATADAAVVAGRLGQPARRSVVSSSGATRNRRARSCRMASRLLDGTPGCKLRSVPMKLTEIIAC